MNINSVNFGKINPSYTKKEENKEEVKKDVVDQQQSNKNYKPADEILNMMAKTNLDVMPKKAKKTIQISKYVTPDQAKRISSAANECIDTLFKFEETALKELDIPSQTAKEVSVDMFNKEYLS